MDWLSIKELIIDSLKLIIVVIIILFLMLYVVSVTQVVGSSMYPTLEDGEVLILNKFQYRFFDIKRGDIVSLDYEDTKYLIKRIIGLPGETVKIVDNELYINDKIYEEEYLSDDLQYDEFSLTDLGYSKIPENMYLVLGDNRENSLDSREIGLIKKEDINGKISLRFWPLNKIKLF